MFIEIIHLALLLKNLKLKCSSTESCLTFAHAPHAGFGTGCGFGVGWGFGGEGPGRVQGGQGGRPGQEAGRVFQGDLGADAFIMHGAWCIHVHLDTDGGPCDLHAGALACVMHAYRQHPAHHPSLLSTTTSAAMFLNPIRCACPLQAEPLEWVAWEQVGAASWGCSQMCRAGQHGRPDHTSAWHTNSHMT